MKITFCFISILLIISCQAPTEKATEAETANSTSVTIDTSDLKSFAYAISEDGSSEYAQAQQVVTWLATNFDWKATDYKRRTVGQIIDRKGGNCAELAKVTKALLKELNLNMRQIREVNHHVYTPRRQKTAAEKVKKNGNRSSVFGLQHNDHVWLEVYDSTTQRWFPADPSLGVIGEEEWLKARLGFGERFTLDESSKDMLFPMAIFAYENRKLVENRTAHYMIDGFDQLYGNQLSQLPEWKKWVELIDFLDDKIQGAFQGEINLHDYEKEIAEIGVVYEQLKKGYEASQ